MKKANEVLVCSKCGSIKHQFNESCDCQQLVKGMPRDGLRAVCPFFQSRNSYHRKYFIVCDGRKICFDSSDKRNEHYQGYCCSKWPTCASSGRLE